MTIKYEYESMEDFINGIRNAQVQQVFLNPTIQPLNKEGDFMAIVRLMATNEQGVKEFGLTIPFKQAKIAKQEEYTALRQELDAFYAEKVKEIQTYYQSVLVFRGQVGIV